MGNEPKTGIELRQNSNASYSLALLLAVGLLHGVAATSALAQSCAKTSTVRIQEWTGDIINMVPWVAEEKGMFRKQCLDVKFVPMVGGPLGIAAIVSNSIEFSNNPADNIIRPRSKGVDVRITSNMYAGAPMALVVRSGQSLPSLSQGYPAVMKDLAGKKIGVTALGGTMEALMRSAFEGAGMDPMSATYVAVGGVGTAVPALKAATVDGAMMFGTGPEIAEALGVGVIVLDLRKDGVGPKALKGLRGGMHGWNAHGPYIDKNPDVVAAFTKANNEAITWIQSAQNRDELYRIVGVRMPLDAVPNREATLKRIVDINSEMLGIGTSKESVAGWNNLLMHLRQIATPIPYEDLVWKTGRP